MTANGVKTPILLLAVICAMAPFAMAMPVPAFPEIAREFGVDSGQVQYLLSAFLLGLGLSQPLMGILSDLYGRRLILVIGFSLFTASSIASYFCDHWGALVICRILQGVGVSAGSVTSRAMITDTEDRESAAASYSMLALAMMIGPFSGPLAGELLENLFGWRSIFATTGIVALLVWLLATLRLPETLPSARRSQSSWRILVRKYLRLLISRSFIGYTLIFCACQSVFFSFLPVGPAIFTREYVDAPWAFTAFWIALVLFYLLGLFINTRLLKQYESTELIRHVCVGLLVFGVAFLVLALSGWGEPLVPLTVFLLCMILTGMANPLSLNGAVSSHADTAGSASGLSSALGMCAGGVCSIASGMLYDDTVLPMIGIMSGCCVLAWVGMRLALATPRAQSVEIQ